MRRRLLTLVTGYATAWIFLLGVIIAETIYALLPGPDQAAVLRWASTNVHNLRHDPVGCLIASAFFPTGSAAAWPFLIALAMFGANRALGNWRTALVCAAGHVIGTLVSEGIVGYRVAHGLLPPASRFIIDVGPSYVVVSAIVVAILFGTSLARIAAAVDLALLVFAGDIFSGLSRLGVAAVGHLTAMVVAALLSVFLAWQSAGMLDRLVPARAVLLRGPATGSAQHGPAAAGRVADRSAHPDEEADWPVRLEGHGDRDPHRDHGDHDGQGDGQQRGAGQ